MHFLISGGTGFIGQAIVTSLASQGHQLTILTRHNHHHEHPHVNSLKWLGPMDRPWEHLTDIDVIINLAGEPLNKGRWTPAKKERILSSRIDATEQIGRIIEHLDKPPQLIINASAIGIYGYSTEARFDESAPITQDNFPAQVCTKWEEAAQLIQSTYGIRTVIARLGIVLGEHGGALKQMKMPYRLFIGGTIGSGRQWVSWIHINDVIGLINHIVNHPDIDGVVNFTSPQPIRMYDFGETLGHIIHRPHWLPVPGFFLKLIFGEMSDMLLKGQHVIPQKAMITGYSFHFASIKEALEDLLI